MGRSPIYYARALLMGITGLSRIITGVVFHPLFWAVEAILPVVPLVTYTQRGQFGLPPIIWYKGNLDSRLCLLFQDRGESRAPGRKYV